MITTVGIYVKQNYDHDVSYHVGFLCGIRQTLINEQREEIGDLVECGQIGNVMLGFIPARFGPREVERPPLYFQDCEFGIQIGPQVPDKFTKKLINAIENAGYHTKLNPPTTTSSPPARPFAYAHEN